MYLADYLVDTDLRPHYGLGIKEGQAHAAISESPERPDPPEGDDDAKQEPIEKPVESDTASEKRPDPPEGDDDVKVN